MNEFLFVMFLVCVLALVLFFFGIYRYQYGINPISFFAIHEIGVLTLLSAAVCKLNYTKEEDLIAVLFMTIIYIAGFFSVFFFKRLCFPRLIFVKLCNIVGENSSLVKYNNLRQLFLIMLAFAMFVLLMQASGLGLIWFTDPRMAYLSSRLGVSFISMMFQWLLLLSLLYYLLTIRPLLFGMIIPVCAYIFVIYFTGCKANLLSGLVMACVYYNFFIKKISMIWIVTGVLMVLGLFLVLLLLHHSYDNVLSSLSYFDYAKNTGKFLMAFDLFGLQYGYGALSDLWFYVPRGLFSNKPFEYGVVLIQKVLSPGSAAAGHTDGMLPWSLAYLDFGVAGVFFSGVFTGIVRRGTYELFLTNRSNIFAFVLMVQLSLFSVFMNTTLPLTIVIAAIFSLFSRKRVIFFKQLKK